MSNESFGVCSGGGSSFGKLEVSSNPSLCAGSTTRPNKLKRRSLEQRKFYCRAEQGEQLARTQRPKLPGGLRGRVFIGKAWGEGCSVCHLPLIGWWGGNRVVTQESQLSVFWFQPVWALSACAQPEVTILHLGGALPSWRRTQRSVSDCYAHAPGGLGPTPCCTVVS